MLAERRAVTLPGAANAMFARVIEELGFEACYRHRRRHREHASWCARYRPDDADRDRQCHGAIADAVNLPLLVDADTGFGNAVNMTRTVKVLERAGAAGIQIEDQVFPEEVRPLRRQGGHSARRNGCQDQGGRRCAQRCDFQIVARTDARAIDGIDAASTAPMPLSRPAPSVTFVEAPSTVAEMDRIARELAVPQIANIVFGGKTPDPGRERLNEMGFAGVLYANAALAGGAAGLV